MKNTTPSDGSSSRETATLSSAPADGRPAPGLFRNRNFLLLWAAYGVSATGDHISEMAVLKVRDAMHAPNLTQLQAMISFMFMLPFFLLGPFTGLLADRLPRRAIMITADIIRALLMFNFMWLMQVFGRGGHWLAFVPFMIVGVFAAVFSPARAAFLPTVIREDQLVRANAMSSGLGVIATMISVAVGGYLAQNYDPTVSFHLDAGTFIVSGLLLAFITRPSTEARRLSHASAEAGGIGPAVSYIRSHRRVIQLILIAVVVWSCGAAVRSTIPTIARDIYHQDYFGIGLFQARLGFGILGGALLLTVLGDALRSEIAITWSLFGIGVAIGLVALTALLPMPTFLAYHIGGVAIILAGVFTAGIMTSYNALLQRIVPNRLRGRVFGLSDVATMAGLLLASGVLGIPDWEHIDRWVGWILIGVTIVVLGASIASLVYRLERGGVRRGTRFWMNVNEFYVKSILRMKREGICTIPQTGPAVIVANHTSGVDPLLIIASCPYRPVGFLIAEEYYHLPLLKHIIRTVECVPVRRGENDIGAFKEALRHLEAGKVLGVFPAGRIPLPGEKVEYHEGAIALALRAGAPVIPVHISGTTYMGDLAKSFFRLQKTRVRFGKPIDLSQYDRNAPREMLAELTRQVMAEVDKLGAK